VAVQAEIVNGQGGQDRAALVNQNHALRTESSVPEILPSGTRNRARYFSDYAYNGAVNNMAVNGAITPVTYSVMASENYDLYLSEVQILIASNSIANNKFADLPALTNGWNLYVTEQGDDTYILNSATTTGELSIRAGGTFTDLANWNPGNDNARVIKIDLAKAFVFDTYRGIRIGRGTRDSVTALVSDDLSGLSEFTVRFFGTRHYP